MAATDFELLCVSHHMILNCIEKIEQAAFNSLQEGVATPDVNTLRLCTMQRHILVSGMFSHFESLIEEYTRRTDPFAWLSADLESKGEIALAASFQDFKDAINALKHGRGKSYKRLLANRHRHGFKVKEENSNFLEEGVVSETPSLIEVDNNFVEDCASLMRKITTIFDSWSNFLNR